MQFQTLSRTNPNNKNRSVAGAAKTQERKEMNVPLNPNQGPPPSGAPESDNAPSCFGSPQPSGVINLSAILGNAASAGQPRPNHAIPFPAFPQPTGLANKNDPPLSANFGTGRESLETHGNGGPNVSGSQPPSGLPNLVAFAAATPEPLKPEDLTNFALPDDYNHCVARKVLTTVLVKKPSKEVFVRTTTDQEGWRTYPLIELKEEGQVYLVTPALAAELEAEGETTLFKARLVPTVDRRGNLFLWMLKVSDREMSCFVSANRGAELAKDKWVRIQWNNGTMAYDVFAAENQESQPSWPDEDLATILRIAFEGKVIKDRNHPVLKELRGSF